MYANLVLFLHMGKFPQQIRRFPFGYFIKGRNFAVTFNTKRL